MMRKIKDFLSSLGIDTLIWTTIWALVTVFLFVSFPNSFKLFLDNLAVLTSWLDSNPGILTVLGWAAVFGFGLRQHRINIRNDAKMRIYTELYEYRKKLDKAAHSLGALLFDSSPPFILMESSDIGNEPVQALAQARASWTKFLGELVERKFAFVDAYLDLWAHFDAWIGLMPELEKSKEVLFSEFSRVIERITNYDAYLRGLSITNYDWHKWDRAEIKKASEGLFGDFSTVTGGYVDDFFGLIHNSLVTPFLGYRHGVRNVKHIKQRMKLKILTKQGIADYEYFPD